MAVTTLDPTTALVVIDLQQGIVALPTADPIGAVLQRASALADAFRRHRLPVVLVNVAGLPPGRTEEHRDRTRLPPGWTDLAPELNHQPDDLLVTKHAWGAFSNTDLAQQLQGRGVTQIVLAGVSTSIGVESTARQAYDFGFNVTLAIDAMTDLNAHAHLNSITRIFPRLGQTGTTREILDLLERVPPEPR